MKTYHKIQTVFKRDPATNHKTLLLNQYSRPEFEFLTGNRWVFTEKVDGTNIRVMWDGEKVTFGGKTDNAQIPGKLVERLIDLFPAEKFAGVFPDMEDAGAGNVCLYGEGYGAGIQKGGGNYGTIQDFVLFDVKCDDWWLKRRDIIDIAIKMGLGFVPVIGNGILADMVDMCRHGFSSIWGDFQAEGIVARPAVELQDRAGDRIITKLKCKDFGPGGL